MSDDAPQCPKCNASMDAGFVLDQTHGANMQSAWLDGVPEESIWTGGVKVRGHQRVPVTTFRCPRCGYLESYAFPE